MKRSATPADVADLVMGLLQSSYVTGEVVVLDGGLGTNGGGIGGHSGRPLPCGGTLRAGRHEPLHHRLERHERLEWRGRENVMHKP